ncbi:hypothetical protein QR680_010436 [Steinernema hermaphroditum]|uniref:F-box domain-containing protein n=1 Tax=Steinernema hermaphroditum TaxID=289476 RepID=A0AA39IRF1_9BILA|nr:hypothetical protein QR680_010436 [Steinernema hermaphroditum]
MDSVPYVFCEDVLERLSRFNLFGMTNLSGQWRSAGQRFLEKRRSFYIIISKDREGWWYGIADEKTRDIENDFPPMDSVPYAFCEDVLERLSKENLDTMADDLSGQWRSAAQRFLEKRRSFYIIISKDREGIISSIVEAGIFKKRKVFIVDKKGIATEEVESANFAQLSGDDSAICNETTAQN